jgi:hypothetical protein
MNYWPRTPLEWVLTVVAIAVWILYRIGRG